MARKPGKTDDVMGAQKMAQTLRDRIRQGTIMIGSFLPTERELQCEFGVSRSTVRRALAVLCESGWAENSPNRGVMATHGPSISRTQNVAFIDHAESVQRDLFFSLGRILQNYGYHLVHVDSRLHGFEGAVEYAHHEGFAAALAWSKVGYPDAERLQKVVAEMPILAVDHSLQTLSTDLITVDNFGGARMAVKHLARLGRQRIAVTGMMDMLEVNHQRYSGYLVGLFDSGLEPQARDVCFCLTSGPLEADMLTLSRRLMDPDRPDGLFIMNDFLAPEILDAIDRAGLRVPEDIAVVAFGRTWPPLDGAIGLTTVDIDWEIMAQAIACRLFDRLEKPLSPPVTVALPVKLVVKGSCGGSTVPVELGGRLSREAGS